MCSFGTFIKRSVHRRVKEFSYEPAVNRRILGVVVAPPAVAAMLPLLKQQRHRVRVLLVPLPLATMNSFDGIWPGNGTIVAALAIAMVPAVPIGITNIERTAFTPHRRQEWISNEAIHNTIITLDKFEVFPVFFPQKILYFFFFEKSLLQNCRCRNNSGTIRKVCASEAKSRVKIARTKSKIAKEKPVLRRIYFSRHTQEVISKDVMSYSMCVVRFIWPFGCLPVPALSIDTVLFHFVCKEEPFLAKILASSFEEFIHANIGVDGLRCPHDETEKQKLTGFAFPKA